MNALVQTAFASLLASVTREIPAPVAPFGYGADISCGDDLDAERQVLGEQARGEARPLAVGRRVEVAADILDRHVALEGRIELVPFEDQSEIADAAGRQAHTLLNDYGVLPLAGFAFYQTICARLEMGE